MDPIDMHLRHLMVFRGSIMFGHLLYSGICWHDGEHLELEQSDGTRVDISHLESLVERPLAGQWAKNYPNADYYVEMTENTEPSGGANALPRAARE